VSHLDTYIPVAAIFNIHQPRIADNKKDIFSPSDDDTGVIKQNKGLFNNPECHPNCCLVSPCIASCPTFPREFSTLAL